MATPTVNTGSPMPVTTTKPKPTQACNYCRSKKVKCDGGCPCRQCLEHLEACVFAIGRRPRKKPTTPHETLAQRLRRLERLLEMESQSNRGAVDATMFSSGGHTTTPLIDRIESSHPPPQSRGSPTQTPTLTPDPLPRSFPSPPTTFAASTPLAIKSNFSPLESPQSKADWNERVFPPARHEPGLEATPSPLDESPTQEDYSLHSDEMSNWEYNGPRSFLSICSPPGIAWVTNQTLDPNVEATISRLARDLTRLLKVESGPLLSSRQQTPEPSSELACLYSTAFFEDCLEGGLGIIDRSWFENKLRLHLDASVEDHDPAWYALRNTVYAFGCRADLSKTISYTQAVAKSWRWFENALSAHMDMLHCRSTMTSIKALILMAYYTECIGSPHLEYSLTSSAVRMGVSKGLHRQPAATWNLSPHETRQRNWLFWTIYCLDRQISSRSGRPPAIDDDDISCHLPQTPSPRDLTHVDVTCALLRFRLAQLSSRAYKRLCSARALRQSTAELVQAVTQLDEEMEAFKASVAHLVRLDEPLELRPTSGSAALPLNRLIPIYFLYYGLLLQIHTPLTLPWFGHADPAQLAACRSEVAHSSRVVATTARAAILATRLTQLDATTPVLTAFYVPFFAVISLFISILKDPTQTTNPSDLVLLDIAAGYASRLEFATDATMCHPFVKDFCQYARSAVDRATAARELDGRPDTTPVSEAPVLATSPGPLGQADGLVTHGFGGEYDPNFEFDMEMWSTLLPVLEPNALDPIIFSS